MILCDFLHFVSEYSLFGESVEVVLNSGSFSVESPCFPDCVESVDVASDQIELVPVWRYSEYPIDPEGFDCHVWLFIKMIREHFLTLSPHLSYFSPDAPVLLSPHYSGFGIRSFDLVCEHLEVYPLLPNRNPAKNPRAHHQIERWNT